MRFFSAGRALAHRNYRLFLAGQSISLVGTWMQQVGLTWLVYRLTGSPFWLGMVGFATQIPTFFVAPFAGVLADRWNRHGALLVTQSLAMTQAVVLVALTWSGRIEIWQVLALGGCLGLVNAFDMPLRQSFFGEMVPRDDLAHAIALNSSIVNGARLIGPSLAGLIIAAAGEVTCFLLNAVSYVAVLAALAAMRDLRRRERPPRVPVLEGLREGFRYAFTFPPIRALLLLVAMVSLTGMPITVLLPVFASKLLGGGPATLGFLAGASGMGALGSAFYLASRRQVPGLGTRLVAAAGAYGVALLGFSLSREFWLSMALLAVVGFCMMLQLAGSNTLLQTIVDEDKRGRVMSFYTMAVMGIAPLGSLLAGSLADAFGAPAAVQVAALASLGTAILFGRALPELRELVRPIYVRAGILPPVAAALQTTAELQTPPEDVG